MQKIALRHVLSWSKLGLEPKFHDPGTFGGFGKRGQTDTHTRFMFYKYRLLIRITWPFDQFDPGIYLNSPCHSFFQIGAISSTMCVS